MSIIHDALKKVQHTLDRNYGRSSKPLTHDTAPERLLNEHRSMSPGSIRPDNQQPSQFKTMLWLGNAILICVGIILILALKILDNGKTNANERSPLVDQRLTQRSQRMASFQTQQPKKPSQPVAVSRPAPAPRPTQTTANAVPASSDELILGGIMLMDDQHVALINDDVYALGDSIDDMEIIEITLKEVKLRDKNGTLTTLKTVNKR